MEAVSVDVPDLGFEDQEIRVGIWLIQEGEQVSIGDRIVELVCPGLLHAVTAPESGLLEAITCQTGARVAVGRQLASIVIDE